MIIVSTSFQSPMRWPSRELGSTWALMLMLSWPPAMMISASPHLIACAARWVAFRPEPQTLPTTNAGTPFGKPDLMTAWRAGFWPAPAVSTWPRMTSLIVSGATPERSSSALMTVAPRSDAGILASDPPNLPTAVRAAATMTTSSMGILLRAG